MIDLHCHILPGIDDGPSDPAVSMTMARIAAADGITRIVASPHFSSNGDLSTDRIREVCLGLGIMIRQEGLPLELVPAADVRLTYELSALIEAGSVPVINGSRYFLLELPDLIPPNVENLLFAAKVKGYAPVITHPERNYSLLASPEKADALRKADVLFQVTAMSITGGFGPAVKSYSRMLLQRGYVDFIATDAHDDVNRAPVLSAAREEVAGMLGSKKTDRIFYSNPEAVLENREVAH